MKTLPMDTPIMNLVRAAPPTPEQSAFNKTRWRQLNQDPKVNRLEWRIETDRHGRMIINPPPHRPHSKQQGQITIPLGSLLGQFGTVHPECPISTSDGVKAADVAWISQQREAKTSDPDLFDTAPEICVEVISPSNTEAEMEEKKSLYVAAGAEEVWFCDQGHITFYEKEQPEAKTASAVCPGFPQTLS